MRKILIVVLAVLASACNRYITVTTRIDVGNSSQVYTAVTVIDGDEAGPDLTPGASTSLFHKIVVADPNVTEPTNYVTSATETASLRFRVRSINVLTQPITCTMGQSLIVHATFSSYGTGPNGTYYASCWTSYPSSFNKMIPGTFHETKGLIKDLHMTMTE
jgi:hypothetical protein